MPASGPGPDDLVETIAQSDAPPFTISDDITAEDMVSFLKYFIPQYVA